MSTWRAYVYLAGTPGQHRAPVTRAAPSGVIPGLPFLGVHGECGGDVRSGGVPAGEVQVRGVGSRPIGVSAAAAWPSIRATSHVSTRLFSPKPGQEAAVGATAEPVHTEDLR